MGYINKLHIDCDDPKKVEAFVQDMEQRVHIIRKSHGRTRRATKRKWLPMDESVFAADWLDKHSEASANRKADGQPTLDFDPEDLVPATVIETGFGEIAYRFSMNSWSVFDWLEAASKAYPDIEFIQEYQKEGHSLITLAIFKNGEMTDHYDPDW